VQIPQVDQYSNLWGTENIPTLNSEPNFLLVSVYLKQN